MLVCGYESVYLGTTSNICTCAVTPETVSVAVGPVGATLRAGGSIVASTADLSHLQINMRQWRMGNVISILTTHGHGVSTLPVTPRTVSVAPVPGPALSAGGRRVTSAADLRGPAPGHLGPGGPEASPHHAEVGVEPHRHPAAAAGHLLRQHRAAAPQQLGVVRVQNFKQWECASFVDML